MCNVIYKLKEIILHPMFTHICGLKKQTKCSPRNENYVKM